ncbi:uracil-DNA glycosylase [Dehalococcoidia bacterium]|nr:uracil-DNA glycosylase [Dehalococcoidia bacterium]
MADYQTLVEQIADCTRCPLSQGRTQSVPGEGSLSADIMFIGEGPGFYEDRDGRPFVGPAGNLLEEMLGKIGLNRQDVYITNMLKCRPPRNRDPLANEIDSCSPYLTQQIEMISPRVIVTLGRFSFSKFFSGETISSARGKARRWRDLMVYPMYHPAAALHNPGLRPAIESDFRRLPGIIEQAGTPNVPEPAPTRQLTMFQ